MLSLKLSARQLANSKKFVNKNIFNNWNSTFQHSDSFPRVLVFIQNSVPTFIQTSNQEFCIRTTEFITLGSTDYFNVLKCAVNKKLPPFCEKNEMHKFFPTVNQPPFGCPRNLSFLWFTSSNGFLHSFNSKSTPWRTIVPLSRLIDILDTFQLDNLNKSFGCHIIPSSSVLQHY